MKNFIRLLIGVFIMLLLPLKGSTMGDNPKKTEQIKQEYAKLNLSDGVNKEEALIIAQYFIINDPSAVSSNVIISSAEVGESGLKNVIGDCWVVSFDSKFRVKLQSGLKWFTVHIDKVTGKVKTWGWGPS